MRCAKHLVGCRSGPIGKTIITHFRNIVNSNIAKCEYLFISHNRVQ